MTKTWLATYEREDYSRLLNTISSNRSNCNHDHTRGKYTEAIQVVRAVAGSVITRESGHQLLAGLIADIRGYHSRRSASPDRPASPPVPPPPAPAAPPTSFFEDGISLQERRRRELAEKWGPLQGQIKRKVADKVTAFRPPRVIRYKRVDNR